MLWRLWERVGMPTRIDVRVQPKASRRDVQREADSPLRVRVTSAAEAGKANEDVLAAIAKALGVPKRGVRIASGHRARSKDLDTVEAQERLATLPISSAAPGG